MPEIPIIETEIVPADDVRGNPDYEGVISKKTPERYRIPKYEVKLVREGGFWADPRQIGQPYAIFELAEEIVGGFDREYMYLVCLDQKNKVIGVNLISVGTINMAVVHPREVMKVAILLNAVSFIVFHTHPSGETTPSEEDLEITRRLKDAGDMMGIRLLDHLIIGDETYLSIFEEYPKFRE